MENLKEIPNLVHFLQEAEERPVLVTGTFDPIHKGHLHDLIIGSLKKYKDDTLLVILPHDVTSSKKNRTPIDQRREWIQSAFCFISKKLKERVLLCVDDSIFREKQKILEIIDKYDVLKISGEPRGEKSRVFERFNTQKITSSYIRACPGSFFVLFF